MFRNEFCEINLLRKLIASDKKWPNVVINTRTKQEYRKDIKGTLSIFSNNRGVGCYIAGSKAVNVNEDTFFISNEEQYYGIDICDGKEIETFNIHFSTNMLRSLLPTLQLSNERLLDNVIVETKDVNFYNKLYWKDDFFRNTVSILQTKQMSGELNEMLTEELLSDLLIHLSAQQIDLKNNINTLSSAKKATKEEVFLRLSLATDFIYANYSQAISLEDLAAISYLSKYHFIRLFKEVYGITPYQYIIAIRLDKARQLLKGTEDTIANIAHSVGYEDISSFSRGFKRHFAFWPSSYRTAVQN